MNDVKESTAQQIRDACRAISQKVDAIVDAAGEYAQGVEIRITVNPNYPAAEVEYNIEKLGIPEAELSADDSAKALGIAGEEKKGTEI